MKQRAMISAKIAVISAGAIAAAALGVWGVGAMVGGSNEPESTLPKEFSTEKLVAQAKQDPDGLWDKMRDARRNEELSEAQRRELGQNMRQAMTTMLDERVDKYFAAKEEDRNALLDDAIDEFQKMRERFEERRKEMEADRAKREAERRQNGDKEDEQSEEARRQEMRRRWVGGTREERKERSESRSADDMARRMSYFRAMHERATARGIEMGGFGRGPGRGGQGRRGPGNRGGGARGDRG